MANRRTKVTFPVFSGFPIIIILSDNPQRTSRALRMYRKPLVEQDVDENEMAAFLSDDHNPLRCWLIFDIKYVDPGTIAHECSHAVWHMLKTVGVVPDDEVHAYHTGYLVNKVHKFMKR